MGSSAPKHPKAASQINWPDLPKISANDPQAEVKKILYQGQIQVLVDQEKDAWANEYALGQAVHNAYIEVAQTTVNRSRDGAKFVERAAATIGAAYTAILALTYTAGGNKPHPLPVSGIVPMIFLGGAIVLAAIYLDYLIKGKPFSPPKDQLLLPEYQAQRMIVFLTWAINIAYLRRYFLQASIFSLGFGVLFLPVAYLSWSDTIIFVLAIGAAILVIVLPWLISKASDYQMLLPSGSGDVSSHYIGDIPTPPNI